MTTARNAAIAIGVGSAPPLRFLQAAINCAKSFHAWATALKYEASLVTDEETPVTIDRLRTEFMTLLNAGAGPIDRFVIYFAGHGLIREAEEGLWLLSDWNASLRAVASEVLKRRLYMYNVGQIAIFADACRVLPDDIIVADLTPDAVLGRGPAVVDEAPSLDKFIAAQDSKAAFALPGDTPEKDVCIFSYALMEALWGLDPAAMSPAVAGKVTSSSLGAYLKAQVPQIAQRYQLKLFPNVSPTFPFGKDIYFCPDNVTPPPSPPDRLSLPDPNVLAQPQGPSPSTLWKTTLSSDDVRPSPGAKGGPPRRSAPPADMLPEAAPPPTILEKMQSQSRPSSFETGSGFAVEGRKVRAIWTPPGVSAEPGDEENWWRLWNDDTAYQHLTRPAPCLIALDDDTFAAVSALPDFIASLLCDERGATALVYRPVHADADAGIATEETISQMEDGAIRGDAVFELVAAMRGSKHSNPVLGAICAYLYDSIGDLSSIRSMAYFYATNGEPIPFDIALLGELKSTLVDDVVHVEIPAVPARIPRNEVEERNPWLYQATPAATGTVGGGWPWLRQGWAFLDDPVDQSSPLVRSGLAELARELRPARFATMTSAGGHQLAKLFNLAEHRPQPEPQVLAHA